MCLKYNFINVLFCYESIFVIISLIKKKKKDISKSNQILISSNIITDKIDKEKETKLSLIYNI